MMMIIIITIHGTTNIEFKINLLMWMGRKNE